MLRICPYSGEKFIPTRKNQVFASPKNRSNYHNEKAAQLRCQKAPISKDLDKNHAILTRHIKKGTRKDFSVEKLLAAGFNPKVFTHFEEFEGTLCRGIYQFLIPTSKNSNSLTIIHK